MRVLNEAIVGEYHFVISDDYLNITLRGEEVVHLSYGEAQEVVPWLMTKLGRFKGEEAVIIPTSIPDPSTYKQLVPSKPLPSSDSLATRSATQSTPLKTGDPFLAAPESSADGKQKIFGVQTMDLAAEMRLAGVPILRK